MAPGREETDAFTPSERLAVRSLLREREAGRTAWKWLCRLGAVLIALAALGASVTDIWRGRH